MKLTKIKTLNELAQILNFESSEISNIIKNKINFIKKYKIRKKGGGYREIYEITELSYIMILRLLNIELGKIEFNNCVHGFVKGRGIYTNAMNHLDKKIIINVDIKDFFNSIEINEIKRVFKQIGICDYIVDILIKLVTINGILPTGFSTSPIIGNLICDRLDNDFLEFSKQNGYIYTRYGDDITLSTNNGKIIKKIEIENILNKNNFKINNKKFKIQKRGGNRYVTGLTVCEKDFPRIPKRIKNKLRQELYYINKYGEKSHYSNIKTEPILKNRSSIYGWQGYIEGIEKNNKIFL